MDWVCMAFLYAGSLRILPMNRLTRSTAMESTLSSLLPYLGKSPSISKSTATPFSLRIGFTLAYFIADSESVTTEKPAMPHPSLRTTSLSMKASCAFS